MISNKFWKRPSALLASLFVMAGVAQTPPALSVSDPAKLTIARNATADYKLHLQVREGFHVNSNKPNDEYLIPIQVTWGEGPLEVGEVEYPKPKLEKYDFSPNPLSIYDGSFDVTTKFKVKTSAAPGLGLQPVKVRYQACTDKMCYPPKTIEVKVPVLVQ